MYLLFENIRNGVTIMSVGDSHKTITGMFALLMLAGFFLSAGCAGTPRNQGLNAAATLEEQWGISVVGIRLTAAGHMLDFRYKVLDPEKASHLLDRQNKSYLVDEKSGVIMTVPKTKIGPLRQTAVKPVAGKNYIVLFGNMGDAVKPGNKVTVVIGNFKAENLIVEQ